MKCSICENDIDVIEEWHRGHNAEPVNDGRCCTECNWDVVIPVRMAVAMYGGRRRKKVKDEKHRKNVNEGTTS